MVVSDSDDEGARDDDSVPEDDDAVPAFPALNSIQRAGGGGSRAAGGLALPHSTTSKPAPVKRSGRGKVALEPGFSQLDWARLKASGADLKVRWPPHMSFCAPSMMGAARYIFVPRIQAHCRTGRRARASACDAFGARQAPHARRCVVGIQRSRLQHHAVSALPSRRRRRAHALGWARRDRALQCAGPIASQLTLAVKTHAWISIEGMLGEAMVGILVRE